MAIINTTNQNPFAGLNQLSQNLVQLALARQRQDLEEQQIDLEERRVTAAEKTQELKQQQIQQQMQDAQAAAAAGPMQLQAFLQQNPKYNQAISAGGGPAITGGPGTGLSTGVVSAVPQAMDPVTAGTLTRGFQQQAKQQAQIEQAEAATEAREVETSLARQRFRHEQEIFPLTVDLKNAEIDAQNAQTAAARARVEQARKELKASLQEAARASATSRMQSFSALSQQFGKENASRMVFGTTSPPALDVVVEQESRFFEQATNQFASEEEYGAFVEAMERGQIAQTTGLSGAQQSFIDGLFASNDSDAQATLEQARDSETIQNLPEETRLRVLKAMTAYLTRITEGKQEIDTKALFENPSDWKKFRDLMLTPENINILGSAGVGATLGSAIPGVGTALGGIGGATAALGAELWKNFANSPEQSSNP